MSKHTPGPWEQGRTLRTSQTRRWTVEQIAANDAIEAKMVFAYFSQTDQGKSRLLVARCEDVENARLIAAAPDGYALALAVLEHFKDTDSPLGKMARDLLEKANGNS